MLAGLLFAIEEAAWPAGRLVATLPFAGSTLIEHQARQLVAAGASQIVVIGDDPGAELAGALHRIGRRGIAVDAVSAMAEAAAKLHPLSRIVMLADGLVAADETVAAVAVGGDALLVVPLDDAPSGFERIGGASAWAGVAQISPSHVDEAAALPADYAPQSTLLRVAEAAGLPRVPLSPAALAAGHGIERDGAAVERRGHRLVAAAVAMRHGWFDRVITAPLARLAMPALAASSIVAAAAALAVAAVALVAGAALLAGWARSGMVLAMIATLGCTLVTTLAVVRDERTIALAGSFGGVVVSCAAVLLLGRWASAERGNAVPLVLAIVLVATAIVGSRAMRSHQFWWGSPPAYALIATVLTIAGSSVGGLGVAALYAGVTLAAAVEAGRGSRLAPL